MNIEVSRKTIRLQCASTQVNEAEYPAALTILTVFLMLCQYLNVIAMCILTNFLQ